MKIRLSRNNNHDGVSHGVECSQEGDRTLHLKSNTTGTLSLLRHLYYYDYNICIAHKFNQVHLVLTNF